MVWGYGLEFGWKWFRNMVGNGLGIWLEMVWNLVVNGMRTWLEMGWESGWKWSKNETTCVT